MSDQASLGSLGEAKVVIRVDWKQLDNDLEKSKVKIGSAFQEGSTVMRNVGAALTGGLTVPIAGLIAVSTTAASRVNELQSVNILLGKSAGYSESFIREQIASVEDMGIEAAASNEVIADFIKADLDLADASKIARVAQDAAVIAGKNSTETTKTLTQAIIKGESELFKSAGMIIDLNQEYEKYAEITGKVASELTQQEKIQARVNATMEYGERIAGAYIVAMKDPGKVLRSYPRYLNEVAIALGQNFIPAFREGVFAGKEFLSWLKDAVSEGGALDPVIDKWGQRFTDVAMFVRDLTHDLDNLDPAILQTVTDFVAWGAAMGPVLLIGGQLSKWALGASKTFLSLTKSFGISKAAAVGGVAPLAASLLAAVGALTLFKNEVEENERVSAVYHNTLLGSSKTYDEYIGSVTKYNEVSEYQRGLIWDTNDAMSAGFGQLRAQSKQIEILTEAQWRRAKAAEAVYDIENQMRENIAGTNFEVAYSQAINDLGADAGYYADQAARAGLSTRDWLIQMGYLIDTAEGIAEITSINSYFEGEVGLAKSYDSILEDIEEKQSRINALMSAANAPMPTGGYFEETYYSIAGAAEALEDFGEITDDNKKKYERLVQITQLPQGGYVDGIWMSAKEAQEEIKNLTGDISDLEAKMEEMANQVVLDMFMATIAIDGVTETESAAYFQLAADLGIISKEAADAAIAAYGDAIDYINDLEIDDKTGEIRMNVTYSDPLGYVTGGTGGGNIRIGDKPVVEQRAGGGDFMADVPQVVGEEGPELLIPSVGGTIIPNDELALISQLFGGRASNSNDLLSPVGGNVYVEANINNKIDIHRFARLVANEFRRG